MNWFAKVLGLLPMIPGIVQGIEGIVKEAGAGATKKQMAMDALGLSVGVADTVDPALKPEVDAAASMASGFIDLIVQGFNAAGWTHPTVVPVVPASPATPVTK